MKKGSCGSFFNELRMYSTKEIKHSHCVQSPGETSRILIVCVYGQVFLFLWAFYTRATRMIRLMEVLL